jgi:putative tricarboxylic transport membrane protein
MNSKVFDRYASVVFFLIGFAFVWESRKISASAYGSNVGPDIFPMGLGIILMLLSIRLFYEVFRAPAEDGKREKPDVARFLLILAAATLYAFFLEDIGYVIGTFLFLLFSFQVMKKGKWITSFMISISFSFGVYYLFVHILQGTLPGFPAWLNIG